MRSFLKKIIYDLVRKHVKIYSSSTDSATIKNLTELIDKFLSEYDNILATKRSFISVESGHWFLWNLSQQVLSVRHFEICVVICLKSCIHEHCVAIINTCTLLYLCSVHSFWAMSFFVKTHLDTQAGEYSLKNHDHIL